MYGTISPSLALCLVHVCPNESENVGGTLFKHNCTDDDTAFLMYPYWNAQTGVSLTGGEIVSSQAAAAYFEEGKTTTPDLALIFEDDLPSGPICSQPDIFN